jgi:hypothetical protein
VAPIKEDAGFNFREITDAKQVDLIFHNTIISPKSAFFPQMEDFVRYQTGKSILEAAPVELNLNIASKLHFQNDCRHIDSSLHQCLA